MPAAAEPVVIADGEADVVLPALIVDAGPDAVQRFLEFFAGRIANARTRAAYGRAVGQFLAWCEASASSPCARSTSAAYIRTTSQSQSMRITARCCLTVGTRARVGT